MNPEALVWSVLRLAQLRGRSQDPLQVAECLQALKTSDEADGGEGWQKDFIRLWKALGGARITWLRSADAAHLPLAAYSEESGVCIVKAQTTDGGWVIELADGTDRIAATLDMARFASLRFPGMAGLLRGTAAAMIRTAFLRRHRIFIECALATCLINALALSNSFFSMQVYDRVIPFLGYDTLWALAVGVLLAIGLELGAKIARTKLLDAATESIDRELSRKLFERVLSIRLDQLPSTVGTLSAQLRGFEVIRAFLSSTTLYMMVDLPFGVLFVIVIGLVGGWQLALVPAVFFALALAVGLLFKWKVQQSAGAGMAAANRKTGILVETIEAAEEIKASGGWRVLSRWLDTAEQAIGHDLKIKGLNDLSSYLTMFFQQVSYVMLVAIGAYEVTQGHLTMGALIACSIISGRVLAPVGMVPGILVQWAHARAALDGLEKVYSLQTDSHGVDTPLAPSMIRGEFRLEDVEFVYPGQRQVLQIPRLDIAAGEKIGIVGPVGAGKSTLLRLLAGLYRARKGCVLIDGLDISHVARSALNGQIGFIPQHCRLLAGTLRENLLLGIRDPGDEAILAAAKRTGLLALISSHPRGLDMEIAEGGAGVSGGQKQIIVFTRQLLAEPTIWLLDEPTAALDEALESQCQEVLKQAIGNEQTLVLVTHKPSMLRLVDRLIIVANHRIVVDGPRDEVLRQLQRTQRPTPPLQAA